MLSRGKKFMMFWQLCCPGYWSCFRCCPGARSSWCFDNFVVLDIDHVLDVVLEQDFHDVLTTSLSWRKIMFMMLSWTKMVDMLSCPRTRCLIVIGFEDRVVLGVWHVDIMDEIVEDMLLVLEQSLTCSENIGDDPFSPRRQMTMARVWNNYLIVI